MTIIFIAYGGRWDSNNKYVDQLVKIMMVPEATMFTKMRKRISKELNLGENKRILRILFDTKIETSKGMTIERDQNLGTYFLLIKIDPEFKSCPMIIEFKTLNSQSV